jgi:N-acetyl-gamma-glutamyl-phosphate reductase/acetylglutamate kinase
MPDVARHGTGLHGATLGGFTYDRASGRLAIVSCVDNLLKGAATQAVQNLNLALGEDEYAGILTTL